MTNRENLIRVLRRDNPMWVPMSFALCPDLMETFKKRTGQTDYMSYYDIPFRYVGPGHSDCPVDYTRYYDSLPKGAYIDDIGVAHVSHGFKHFTKMLHPMEKFNTPEEIWAFPLPDTSEDYRWNGVADNVKRLQNDGYAAVYSAVQIFEPTWYLRGMENLLCDMLANEDMAAACLDRMTEFQTKITRKATESGVDMIVFGDDVGIQKGLMMSPEQWRKWIKPTTARVISEAKAINPDVICKYHSDGNIYEIIDDLIEIGVDVLNPVQPECMDPLEIKKKYGDILSFWGTIGTQTTMPFGTPFDVEMTVKRFIETVGIGGGLVIAPTHLLEPEVPWENIEALINAVKVYGRY